MNSQTLSDIIKNNERNHEIKVNYDNFLIIRIDGHKFSKFTKRFKKPFDMILSNTMENTSRDLIEKFGCSSAYTQSDEITLFFPPVFNDNDTVIINNQIFGGRTQKIASLVASYTSIRFNYWFNKEYENTMFDENESDYRTVIENHIGTAWFDARVFGVRTKEDAFNVFKWRALDAIKNSLSMFAQAYCSHRSLLNKSGKEQIAFCLETTGNDWNLAEDRFKYGILIKKERFMKNTEYGLVERTHIISFSRNDWCDCSEENIDFIISKKL